MANRFSVQSADISMGIKGALAGLEARNLNQQKAQEQAKQGQLIKQAQDLMRSGNPQDIAAFSLANPEIGQRIDKGVGHRSDQTREARKQAMMNIVTGANPRETVQNLIAKITELGGDPSDTMKLLQLSDEDIVQRTKEQIPWQFPEIAKILSETGGNGGGDLPAEAVTFNDLIKDFTPDQQKTAKLVKAGLKGRAMSNAELSAIESGDIRNYADWKAQMRQQQKFAEMTGASRAKAIDRGFDSIVKIGRGIKNIDDAIAVLDKGAGVGAVEKFWPSIKAASVELDNIRGRMALDVIGSVTFGALSKGELDLAKDIALPTGLNTDELIDYLNRKKDAQIKLRTYYNEQIQFLDQGGTVAGFLREKERTQGGGTEGPDLSGVSDEDLFK